MANPFKVPLNAIRAIEILARGGTLSVAAAELGVTPGAVSQHLKRAEERLGYVLFERTPTGLRPTPALDAALPFFEAGFRSLAAGIAAIEAEHRCTLTLSAPPTFAARWLVPRLARFTATHPEVEIRFITTAALVDLAHADIDFGIRLGRGDWRGVEAECLLPQPFFPVCTPDWRARLTRPADLADVPVIVDEGAMVDWKDWFAACGEAMPPLHGPRYSDPGIALEAALSGQGVMLAWDMVASDAIAMGRLVRPFAQEASGGLAYWFVTLAGRRKSRPVQDFYDWLRAEMRDDRTRLSPAANASAMR